MLAALCWWAVLLHRKNVEVFKLESKLLVERHLNDIGVPSVDITTLPEYAELKQNYESQTIMIASEAMVFGIVLILGIYFINRAFSRELAVAEKQKNFLLSITHELKSPLASINLILDTFVKRDLPPDRIKEFSKDALTESTRLDELFNKILLATRLGSTHQFAMQQTNISSIIEHTLQKIERVHTELTLTSDIQKSVICKVDESAMASVLHNLVENALKYTTGQPKVHITLAIRQARAVLSISDNGIGIAPNERQRIFEQFYRIGSEDTRTSKGTGLGLYIVKEIVTAHKGKIKVADNTEGGTTFEISLPVAN